VVSDSVCAADSPSLSGAFAGDAGRLLPRGRWPVGAFAGGFTRTGSRSTFHLGSFLGAIGGNVFGGEGRGGAGGFTTTVEAEMDGVPPVGAGFDGRGMRSTMKKAAATIAAAPVASHNARPATRRLSGAGAGAGWVVTPSSPMRSSSARISSIEAKR